MQKYVLFALLLVIEVESRISNQRYAYVIDPKYGEGKIVNTTVPATF